jgi:hypothetical protein
MLLHETSPGVEIIQPYDTGKVTNLIVNSFRFSRGSSTLHNAILLYLADSFGERFTADNISDAVPSVIRAAERYTSNPHMHVQLPRDVIEAEVARRTNYLSDAVKYNFSCSPEALLESVLEADIVKIPGYDNIQSISNFVTYALLGRSTRSEEYDSLFKLVADTYMMYPGGTDANLSPDNALSFVPQIIDTHLQAHPNDAGEIC